MEDGVKQWPTRVEFGVDDPNPNQRCVGGTTKFDVPASWAPPERAAVECGAV